MRLHAPCYLGTQFAFYMPDQSVSSRLAGTLFITFFWGQVTRVHATHIFTDTRNTCWNSMIDYPEVAYLVLHQDPMVFVHIGLFSPTLSARFLLVHAAVAFSIMLATSNSCLFVRMSLELYGVLMSSARIASRAIVSLFKLNRDLKHPGRPVAESMGLLGLNQHCNDHCTLAFEIDVLRIRPSIPSFIIRACMQSSKSKPKRHISETNNSSQSREPASRKVFILYLISAVSQRN
jgi:hypothetical protein